MKPRVYAFEDPVAQTVWYRGYIELYHERTIEKINCETVRPNRLQALEDAKKLITIIRAKSKGDGKS